MGRKSLSTALIWAVIALLGNGMHGVDAWYWCMENQALASYSEAEYMRVWTTQLSEPARHCLADSSITHKRVQWLYNTFVSARGATASNTNPTPPTQCVLLDRTPWWDSYAPSARCVNALQRQHARTNVHMASVVETLPAGAQILQAAAEEPNRASFHSNTNARASHRPAGKQDETSGANKSPSRNAQGASSSPVSHLTSFLKHHNPLDKAESKARSWVRTWKQAQAGTTGSGKHPASAQRGGAYLFQNPGEEVLTHRSSPWEWAWWIPSKTWSSLACGASTLGSTSKKASSVSSVAAIDATHLCLRQLWQQAVESDAKSRTHSSCWFLNDPNLFVNGTLLDVDPDRLRTDPYSAPAADPDALVFLFASSERFKNQKWECDMEWLRGWTAGMPGTSPSSDTLPRISRVPVDFLSLGHLRTVRTLRILPAPTTPALPASKFGQRDTDSDPTRHPVWIFGWCRAQEWPTVQPMHRTPDPHFLLDWPEFQDALDGSSSVSGFSANWITPAEVDRWRGETDLLQGTAERDQNPCWVWTPDADVMRQLGESTPPSSSSSSSSSSSASTPSSVGMVFRPELGIGPCRCSVGPSNPSVAEAMDLSNRLFQSGWTPVIHGEAPIAMQRRRIWIDWTDPVVELTNETPLSAPSTSSGRAFGSHSLHSGASRRDEPVELTSAEHPSHHLADALRRIETVRSDASARSRQLTVLAWPPAPPLNFFQVWISPVVRFVKDLFATEPPTPSPLEKIVGLLPDGNPAKAVGTIANIVRNLDAGRRAQWNSILAKDCANGTDMLSSKWAELRGDMLMHVIADTAGFGFDEGPAWPVVTSSDSTLVMQCIYAMNHFFMDVGVDWGAFFTAPMDMNALSATPSPSTGGFQSQASKRRPVQSQAKATATASATETATQRLDGNVEDVDETLSVPANPILSDASGPTTDSGNTLAGTAESGSLGRAFASSVQGPKPASAPVLFGILWIMLIGSSVLLLMSLCVRAKRRVRKTLHELDQPIPAPDAGTLTSSWTTRIVQKSLPSETELARRSELMGSS